MKTLLPFLIALLACYSSKGTVSNFDQSFKQSYQLIATEIAVKDIDKAYRMADSLLNASSENKYKMRALMLIANLNLKNGNNSSATIYALSAEKIAEQLKDYSWLVRINGFLSTTYRNVGLNAGGRKHLEKAIELKAKTDKPILLEMLIDQELAFYHLDDGLYDNTIAYTLKAEENYYLLPDNQRDVVFGATNSYIMGSAYLKLNMLDSAAYFFHKGLAVLDTVTNEAKGFLLLGLAETNFRKKSFDSADYYFKQSEILAQSSKNFNLKIDLANGQMNFHEAQNNEIKFNHFKELYLTLSAQQASNIKKIANEIIANLNEGKTEPGQEHNPTSPFKAALLIIVSGILSALLIYWWRFKRQPGHYVLDNENDFKATTLGIPNHSDTDPTKKIPNVEEKAEVVDESSLTPNLNQELKPKLPDLISEETANAILKNLSKFENDKGFLKKEISLSALATKLKTNTKYLSYVLNNYVNKDFNQYINELRIEFLILTLLSQEVFWEYKIAFWADHAGFSSHSKFTTAFKKVTQQTPSEFVQMLRNLNQREIEDLKNEKIEQLNYALKIHD